MKAANWIHNINRGDMYDTWCQWPYSDIIVLHTFHKLFHTSQKNHFIFHIQSTWLFTVSLTEQTILMVQVSFRNIFLDSWKVRFGANKMKWSNLGRLKWFLLTFLSLVMLFYMDFICLRKYELLSSWHTLHSDRLQMNRCFEIRFSVYAKRCTHLLPISLKFYLP